jgi:protein-tyrosine-phosphatase
MTPSEVTSFIKDKGIKLIDFKFADLLGTWQHFTTTLNEYSEDIFTDGLGFDGSSIRGWQAINASDMLIIPDPDSARIDPFLKDPTLVMICDVVDPITRENYSRDPRNIAKKAEAFLKAYAGDHFEVLSAGMEPRDRIHPVAFSVMEELGIELRGQSPKSVKEYLGHVAVSHAIIVCQNVESSCPRLYPGSFDKRFWPFEDPASFRGTPEEQLGKFRAVRDEIDRKIKEWLAEQEVLCPTN